MALARAVVVGLGLVLAAGAAAEDDKKPALDPEKLIGGWKITAGTRDGNKAENAAGDVTVTKDKITMKVSDDMVFEFGYKLDPKASPATIDMEILAPEGFKGAKANGIVALDKETLKLAYHPMGGARPKDFEAKKDSGEFSFELKKAEKK